MKWRLKHGNTLANDLLEIQPVDEFGKALTNHDTVPVSYVVVALDGIRNGFPYPAGSYPTMSRAIIEAQRLAGPLRKRIDNWKYEAERNRRMEAVKVTAFNGTSKNPKITE